MNNQPNEPKIINGIDIKDFVGTFPRNTYSDYEVLAFMNFKRTWLEQLFSSVKDIGSVFCPYKKPNEYNDYMDLVFYNAVHVLHSYVEADGRVSKRMVDMVVETVCYTLDTIKTNDHITRSGVSWSSPDAYTEWWQSA